MPGSLDLNSILRFKLRIKRNGPYRECKSHYIIRRYRVSKLYSIEKRRTQLIDMPRRGQDTWDEVPREGWDPKKKNVAVRGQSDHVNRQ